MQEKLFLEERKLEKRWSGPWPLILNTAFVLALFISRGGSFKTLGV